MRRQWHTPARLAECTAAELSAVLDDAIVVSAMTCGRAGANPPRLAEVTETSWGQG
jgi:fructokinase